MCVDYDDRISYTMVVGGGVAEYPGGVGLIILDGGVSGDTHPTALSTLHTQVPLLLTRQS